MSKTSNSYPTHKPPPPVIRVGTPATPGPTRVVPIKGK
jgi:hypothetical protein